MKRSPLIGAITLIAALTASLPLLAADTMTWPWKDKTPPNPALVTLYQIDGVSAAINKSNPPTVAITVEASAATLGFTELQLTPRMGDRNDLIFAFDAKGRRPEKIVTQVITPVTISAEYTDAPVDKVGVNQTAKRSL
jgi:hypothetical protein